MALSNTIVEASKSEIQNSEIHKQFLGKNEQINFKFLKLINLNNEIIVNTYAESPFYYNLKTHQKIYLPINHITSAHYSVEKKMFIFLLLNFQEKFMKVLTWTPENPEDMKEFTQSMDVQASVTSIKIRLENGKILILINLITENLIVVVENLFNPVKEPESFRFTLPATSIENILTIQVSKYFSHFAILGIKTNGKIEIYSKMGSILKSSDVIYQNLEIQEEFRYSKSKVNSSQTMIIYQRTTGFDIFLNVNPKKDSTRFTFLKKLDFKNVEMYSTNVFFYSLNEHNTRTPESIIVQSSQQIEIYSFDRNLRMQKTKKFDLKMINENPILNFLNQSITVIESDALQSTGFLLIKNNDNSQNLTKVIFL